MTGTGNDLEDVGRRSEPLLRRDLSELAGRLETLLPMQLRELSVEVAERAEVGTSTYLRQVEQLQIPRQLGHVHDAAAPDEINSGAFSP